MKTKKTPRMNRLVLWFTKITGAIPTTVFFKTKRYHESEKRLGRREPAIVLANHASLVDFALMLTVFPFRTIRYLMAELLFGKGWILSWFLYKIGGIKIDRDNPAEAAYITKIQEARKKGHLIGIFPEGRLNHDPRGELLEFKMGAAYFALKYGFKVQPVYHNFNYGPYKRVRVMLGDPIDLAAEFPGELTNELLKEATDYLRKRIIALRELMDKRVKSEREKKEARKSYKVMSALIFNSIPPALFALFRTKYYFVDKSIQGRRLPGASIVVANHTAFFDPPLVCTAFRWDKLHMIAGEILYDNPIFAWLLHHLGSIRIDRNAIDMDSFRSMTAALKKGESVGLFPEGMLNRTDELLPFKAGMVLAAVKTGAPIIIVYIGEKYKLFGKRQKVLIDTPFLFDRTARLTGEYLDKVAEDIRQRMLELKDMLEEKKNVKE